MNWSQYSASEKWKIIKSKIKHNNIISVALHTHDLELFKKILSVENITFDQDKFINKIMYYGVEESGKFIPFLQELYNYLNAEFSDKEDLLTITTYLEYILNGGYRQLCKLLSDNYLPEKQIKEQSNYELFYKELCKKLFLYQESLECYLKSLELPNNLEASLDSKFLGLENQEFNLNYADLESQYYKESLDCYLESNEQLLGVNISDS